MHSRSFTIALWLALLIPAGLLAGALISQYVFGLHPCEMCYWQRWPQWVALALAALAWSISRPAMGVAKFLTLLAALAIFISGAIGAFHAGVEYGWWKGVTDCASSVQGETTAEIMDNIMNAPLVRCDKAQWTLWGISLAGFNFLLSCGGAIVILVLLRNRASGNPIRGPRA